MNNKEQDIPLQSFKVEEKSELLNFLIEQKIRKSRNAIKSLLSHKQVKINGNIVTQFNQEILPGDTVTIHKNNHDYDIKVLDGIKIVYEDKYLIVVHKDPKVLSIATDKEKTETAYNTINKYLRSEDPEARAYVIHRLDRDASGLMIYAKDQDVQKMFQHSWNDIVKYFHYAIVVEGRFRTNEGSIISWLTEDKNYVMYSSEIDNGGQKAITHYNTIKKNRKFTLLSIELETRHKNQIRVQMGSIGHPIVGDKKYGSKMNPIKRMALHAYEIKLIHPVKNEVLVIKSPVPESMMNLVTIEKNK